MSTAPKGPVRLIKRYGNRKLYDVEASRYVTLDAIRALVQGGEDVRVVDNDSGEDLTRVTFAQIIYEAEKKTNGGAGRLSLPLLRRLVQFGDEAVRDLRRGVERGREALESVREGVQRLVTRRGAAKGGPPRRGPRCSKSCWRRRSARSTTCSTASTRRCASRSSASPAIPPCATR